MPRVTFMAAMLAFVAASVAGCTDAVTEIVLVVDTDMVLGTELDGVTIWVTGQSDAGRMVAVDLGPGSRIELPIVLGLVPSAGSTGAVDVEVVATLRGSPVVRARARTSFDQGKIRELSLPLLRSCQCTTCSEEETCGSSGCYPFEIDSLPEWSGHASRLLRVGDAGVVHACTGMDAGQDAAPDARLMDGSARDAHDSDARMCTPCAPFPQSGCEPSQTCIDDAGASCTMCIAAGTGMPGVPCASHRDCTTGYACVGVPARCAAYCVAETACSDPSGRSLCVALDLAGGPVRLGYCTTGCDPATGSSCPTGLACEVVTDAPGYTDCREPGPVADSRWLGVVAGSGFTCGVHVDGTAYCWGESTVGQIGDGTTTPDRWTPTLVSGGFTDWVSARAGGTHACGRRSGGQVYCWGSNLNGRLGDGTTVNKNVPTQEMGASTLWTDVSAGNAHSCGRRGDGTAYCWGKNRFGQLGDGTTVDKAVPTLVSGDVTTWASVDVGAGHTCATRADGTLWCWGENASGQLGNGTTNSSLSPVQPAGGPAAWTTVSAGIEHTCGTGTDGTLWCWGPNTDGRLGDGTTNASLTPVRESTMSVNWASVDTGTTGTCGRRADATLYCWGRGTSGRIGDGTTVDKWTPTLVSGGVATWTSVTTSSGHSCATRADNTAWCWGNNSHGGLGNGMTSQSTVPVQVSP